MTTHAVSRRLLAFAGVAAGLVLAGCTSNTNNNQPADAGMMGDGSGCRYSAVTCSAPSPLPGRTVPVTLADMGMTQMMGGTAPPGARMMLRAAATTVPAGQISLVASNMGWRTHELVILPLATGAVSYTHLR